MQQLPEKNVVRAMERLEELNISSTAMKKLIEKEINKRKEKSINITTEEASCQDERPAGIFESTERRCDHP